MTLRPICTLLLLFALTPHSLAAANIENMDPVQLRYPSVGPAVEAGGSTAIVGEIEVKVGPSNIHELRRIRLRNLGTAKDGQIRNIALYNNGEIVTGNPYPVLSNGEANMLFDPPFFMKEDTSALFIIYAEVMYGDGETIALGLAQPSDLYAVSWDYYEEDTAAPVEVSGTPTSVQIIADFMEYDSRCGGMQCAETPGYPAIQQVGISEDYDAFTVMLESIPAQEATLQYEYTADGGVQGGGTQPIQGKSMMYMTGMKDMLDSAYGGTGKYAFRFAVCPLSAAEHGGGMNDDCGPVYNLSVHYQPPARYTMKNIGVALYGSGGGNDANDMQYFNTYAVQLKFVPSENIVLQGGRVDIRECFKECTVQMIMSTATGKQIAKSLHRDADPYWLSYLNFEEGEVVLEGGKPYDVFLSVIADGSTGYAGIGATDFSRQNGLGSTTLKWVDAGEGYAKNEVHPVGFSFWGKTADGRTYEIPIPNPFARDTTQGRAFERAVQNSQSVDLPPLQNADDHTEQPSGVTHQLQNPESDQNVGTRQSLHQERVCARVTSRFGSNAKMRDRINQRFQKRWGFTCVR